MHTKAVNSARGLIETTALFKKGEGMTHLLEANPKNEIEVCVCCCKFRVLNRDGTWSNFMDGYNVKRELAKDADFIICEHCQKKYSHQRSKKL